MTTRPAFPATRSQVDTVHITAREYVPYPPWVADGALTWVARRTLCGVKTWGPADGHTPTCGRCLRITDRQSRRGV